MWNIHYSYARPAARTADQVGQPPASHVAAGGANVMASCSSRWSVTTSVPRSAAAWAGKQIVLLCSYGQQHISRSCQKWQ